MWPTIKARLREEGLMMPLRANERPSVRSAQWRRKSISDRGKRRAVAHSAQANLQVQHTA